MSKKQKKQKRENNDDVTTVMGVAWYRREQWDRLLEISSDRNELERTYDEWRVMAEIKTKELAKHGYEFRKIAIDVEELLKWCNSKKRPVNGDARSEFTAIKLREQESGT